MFCKLIRNSVFVQALFFHLTSRYGKVVGGNGGGKGDCRALHIRPCCTHLTLPLSVSGLGLNPPRILFRVDRPKNMDNINKSSYVKIRYVFNKIGGKCWNWWSLYCHSRWLRRNFGISFFYKFVIAVFHAEMYCVCRPIYVSLPCNAHDWRLPRLHLFMGLILFRIETKQDGSSSNASVFYSGSSPFESQHRSWPPRPTNSVVFPQALQLQPDVTHQIRP